MRIEMDETELKKFQKAIRNQPFIPDSNITDLVISEGMGEKVYRRKK
jgi:hypothetical protein